MALSGRAYHTEVMLSDLRDVILYFRQAFDTEKVSANVYNLRTLQIHLFPQQSVIKDYETYNNKETSFCK